MRVKDAAERLEVGIKTVYAMVAAGKIRCYRIGMGRGAIRISEEHVEEYLKAAEQGPPAPVAPARAPKFNLKHLRLP